MDNIASSVSQKWDLWFRDKKASFQHQLLSLALV